MMRGLKILNVLVLLIVFQGCVSLKVKEKFRVDQTIDGNAGYVVGEPKIDETPPADLTRNLLDIDVKNIKVANPWTLIKKADEWTKEYLW